MHGSLISPASTLYNSIRSSPDTHVSWLHRGSRPGVFLSLLHFGPVPLPKATSPYFSKAPTCKMSENVGSHTGKHHVLLQPDIRNYQKFRCPKPQKCSDRQGGPKNHSEPSSRSRKIFRRKGQMLAHGSPPAFEAVGLWARNNLRKYTISVPWSKSGIHIKHLAIIQDCVLGLAEQVI